MAFDHILQIKNEPDIIESTLKSIDKLSTKIHKDYFHSMKLKSVYPKDMIEYIAPPDRRQGRLRKVLSLEEKLEIC